ncbi:hypothetical protein D3C78_834640 [compost metagenome]
MKRDNDGDFITDLPNLAKSVWRASKFLCCLTVTGSALSCDFGKTFSKPAIGYCLGIIRISHPYTISLLSVNSFI